MYHSADRNQETMSFNEDPSTSRRNGRCWSRWCLFLPLAISSHVLAHSYPTSLIMMHRSWRTSCVITPMRFLIGSKRWVHRFALLICRFFFLGWCCRSGQRIPWCHWIDGRPRIECGFTSFSQRPPTVHFIRSESVKKRDQGPMGGRSSECSDETVQVLQQCNPELFVAQSRTISDDHLCHNQ